MFYDAIRNEHGLKHDPFKALVAPRPIGWISTLSAEGKPNLAPYSFFNGVSDKPHIVMFSSHGKKDTIANIEATGEFVCNLATYDLRDQMNATSAPVAPDVDEFALAGLTPVPSRLVRPPRVGESPAALECRLTEVIELKDLEGRGGGYYMALGQVVGIHIDDAAIRDGMIDVAGLKTLARLGYHDYTAVERLFRMTRPEG